MITTWSKETVYECRQANAKPCRVKILGLSIQVALPGRIIDRDKASGGIPSSVPGHIEDICTFMVDVQDEPKPRKMLVTNVELFEIPQ